MMIVIDLFFLGGWRYIFPDPSAVPQVEVVDSYIPVPVEDYLPSNMMAPQAPTFAEDIMPDDSAAEDISPVDPSVDEAVIKSPQSMLKDAISQFTQPVEKTDVLKWKKYAVAFAPSNKTKAEVIIIIDDMGMNAEKAQAVLDLPTPLTLAYLPYAPHLKTQTQDAHKRGHELMIHTPMEAMDPDQYPGPIALMDNMTPDEVDEQLKTIFASFDGYIGINNHMGSRLTQNERIMHQVMDELKKRGLVFIDSKTSAKSVAAKIAKQTGIYYAQRDVFLDHEPTLEFVRNALTKLEKRALKRGYAIAIGHPKDVTIQGLKEWIPTLESKGIQLAPVSAVLSYQPQAQQRLAQP